MKASHATGGAVASRVGAARHLPKRGVYQETLERLFCHLCHAYFCSVTRFLSGICKKGCKTSASQATSHPCCFARRKQYLARPSKLLCWSATCKSEHASQRWQTMQRPRCADIVFQPCWPLMLCMYIDLHILLLMSHALHACPLAKRSTRA